MTIYKLSNGECYSNFVQAMKKTKDLLLKKITDKIEKADAIPKIDFNITIKDKNCVIRGKNQWNGRTMQCSFRMIPVDEHRTTMDAISYKWEQEIADMYND